MDPLCNLCSQGPAGIDGHADLWVRSLGGSQMSFRCQRCHSLWSRTIRRDGTYGWAPMSERTAMGVEGISVPPRTAPLAVYAWRATGLIKPGAADRS